MQNLKVVQREFRIFGTDADLQIIVEFETEHGKAQKDLEIATQMLADYEKMFSRFDEESELSKINVKTGIFLDASVEMVEVARHALAQHEKTRGLFDPRIIEILENVGYDRDFKNISESAFLQKENADLPQYKLSDDLIVENGRMKLECKMDFAGLVKGWAIDKISGFFLSRGWKNFLVDLGGDMYFSGRDENKEKWSIDIEGIDYNKIMLELSDLAVATSGIGRRKWEVEGQRFHHLVNPKKPREFLFDLKSVTVVASTAEQADVWAKAIFLMGEKDGIMFAQENEIACAVLNYKGGAIISEGIKKYLLN